MDHSCLLVPVLRSPSSMVSIKFLRIYILLLFQMFTCKWVHNLIRWVYFSSKCFSFKHPTFYSFFLIFNEICKRTQMKMLIIIPQLFLKKIILKILIKMLLIKITLKIYKKLLYCTMRFLFVVLQLIDLRPAPAKHLKM